MLSGKQIAALAGSQEYQNILKDDPILRELENSKYSTPGELANLFDLFGTPCSILGKPIQFLSPAVWAFLSALESPYTRGKEPSEADTDLFFFLLCKGLKLENRQFTAIVEKSFGFCKNLGLDWNEVKKHLFGLINRTFAPLNMLPPSPVDEGNKTSFNSLWLAGIVSLTSRMTGLPVHSVMFDMPLSSCFYYNLVYIRENSPKRTVRPRTTSEIDKQIFDRTMELGAQFCKEHNII